MSDDARGSPERLRSAARAGRSHGAAAGATAARGLAAASSTLVGVALDMVFSVVFVIALGLLVFGTGLLLAALLQFLGPRGAIALELLAIALIGLAGHTSGRATRPVPAPRETASLPEDGEAAGDPLNQFGQD